MHGMPGVCAEMIYGRKISRLRCTLSIFVGDLFLFLWLLSHFNGLLKATSCFCIQNHSLCVSSRSCIIVNFIQLIVTGNIIFEICIVDYIIEKQENVNFCEFFVFFLFFMLLLINLHKYNLLKKHAAENFYWTKATRKLKFWWS